MIGAGTIGREWMADAIAAQPDGELHGIASSDPDRARAFAHEKNIPVAYDSVTALLDDPEIDAVYISTTNELHMPQTLAAAAAGKHIFCEKPVDLDLNRARECEKAVRAAKGKVKLVKMNIDEHPAIPGQMGIQSIPAVIAFVPHTGAIRPSRSAVEFGRGLSSRASATWFVSRLFGTSVTSRSKYPRSNALPHNC